MGTGRSSGSQSRTWGLRFRTPGGGFRKARGVPPSGTMDPTAARWANRLLDNPRATRARMCLQGSGSSA